VADALDDIRDLVHAQAALLAAVGANFGSTLVEVQALNEYPRVIWVSAGGTVDKTEYIGGRPNAGGTTRNRQIRTDSMAVEWHIWGRDREAARDIMYDLVAACVAEARGAVDFGTYQWVTQLAPRAEVATHGEKIVLKGTFQLPIHEGVENLTAIATQHHSGSFEDPATGPTTTGICET